MNASASWAEIGLDKDDEEFRPSSSPKHKMKRKRKRKKSEQKLKKKKRKFTSEDIDTLNGVPKKKRIKKKNWNRSKYRGVTWDGRTKRWLCRVKWNGGLKYVGYFDSELEAAQRHDERARKMYAGNLSAIKLNFEHPPQFSPLESFLEERKKRLKVKREPGVSFSTWTSGGLASRVKLESDQNGVMNPSDSDSEDGFQSSVQPIGSSRSCTSEFILRRHGTP